MPHKLSRKMSVTHRVKFRIWFPYTIEITANYSNITGSKNASALSKSDVWTGLKSIRPYLRMPIHHNQQICALIWNSATFLRKKLTAILTEPSVLNDSLKSFNSQTRSMTIVHFKQDLLKNCNIEPKSSNDEISSKTNQATVNNIQFRLPNWHQIFWKL